MKNWLLFALLALPVVYLPAVRGGWIWDDDRYVTRNAALESGPAESWKIGRTPQFYPMTFSTFWLERRVWGDNPAGYHLDNLILHALNAFLVWLVLARLGFKWAGLAAALFALHPVHAESVAWITERKNVLSAFFYLCAAWSWLEYEEGGRRRWYAAAFALFWLALLSKTVACTLPVALLLTRWVRKRPLDAQTWTELAPFFAAGAAMGLLTAWVETSFEGAVGPEYALTAVQRFLLVNRALWFYPAKLVWPFGLSFVYERWTIDPSEPVQWLWPAATAAAACAAWVKRKDIPRGAFAAALFYGATIFPALGLFSVYPQRYSWVADHFQYLASLGPLAALCSLGGARRPAAAAVLALCAALTFGRAGVFASEEAVWRDALEKNPKAYLAALNLGRLLADQGRLDEAIALNARALNLKPALAEAEANMGNALLAKGEPAQAAAFYRLAIAHGELPATVRTARNNLGVALMRQGKADEAAAHYREILAADPADAGARNNLCFILEEQGKTADAPEYCPRRQRSSIKATRPSVRKR